MGLIGKLKSFTRTGKWSTAVADPGGGYNVNAIHYSDPGDDSHPMPDDLPSMITTQRTNGRAAVGYIDLKNDQKAEAGEKRIYSRNAAGEAVVELWLKNDGSAILSNALGSIKLLADGSVDINGVTIDAAGSMSVPASLQVNSKELNLHVHPGVTSGPSSTGPF